MLFNSYIFVFLFFPVSLAGYWLCGKAAEKKGRSFLPSLFLVAASLLFYGYLKPAYLPVLLVSLLVNFAFYRQIEKRKEKKAFLAGGIFLDLLVLGIFKYTGSTFVPLGISFFTFSQIAFLVEGYRGSLKRTSLLDYSVYLTFFPKIMEGPIALPTDFLSAYQESGKKGFSIENLYRGLTLFILGLSKKVLLADTLGKAVDFGYSNLSVLNTPDALIVMLSYTLQLYFDFSGYSDMAIGLGQAFGFTFKENFNYPYIAQTMQEFWRRWHISLSTWFREYVYIPLGGNRVSKTKWLRNILVVWLLTGLWHGAAWNFVLWGLYFFVLLCIERLLRNGLSRIPKPVRHLVTLVLILFSWNIFYHTDLTRLLESFRILFGLSGSGFTNETTNLLLRNNLPLLLVCAVGCTAIPQFTGNVIGLLCAEKRDDGVGHKVYAALTFVFDLALLALATISLAGSSYNAFLYFRF